MPSRRPISLALVLLVAAIGALTLAPRAEALSNGPGCGFNPQLISDELREANKLWRSDEGILRPRRLGRRGDTHMQMPRPLVREMVYAGWRSFGFSPPEAKRHTRRNLAQIEIESSRLPYILQSKALRDVNRHNPAGGLFQFIPETFEAWQIRGERLGDRFNPLANVLAAVNAQVNSGMKRSLDGSSGWGPGYTPNPCR